MKLHELVRLNEGTHTIQGNVDWLDDLKDENGEYLAGTVNVTGHVSLSGPGLKQFPVRFGAVGSDFGCGWNRLTSLEGAPSAVGGNFSCSDTRLTSLRGVHRILRRIDGRMYIRGNEIVSGGIGLVLVEGLTEIDADQPAFEIIEKYLGQGNRGVLRCQEALHEANLGEFAKI